MKKKNIAIVTGASSGLGKEFVKLLSTKKDWMGSGSFPEMKKN